MTRQPGLHSDLSYSVRAVVNDRSEIAAVNANRHAFTLHTVHR